MGIRKEIERLEAEEQAKQERIRQERLVIIGKIKERLDFLNEEARALVRPHLQVLQESGAIEVLRELKEVAGIQSDVEVLTSVFYHCPIRGESGGWRRHNWEERQVTFEKEDLVINDRFPNFMDPDWYYSRELNSATESDYYNKLLEYDSDFLREEANFFSLIKPKEFKSSGSVSLLCCSDMESIGGLYEFCGYRTTSDTLLLSSLWPDRAVKLRLKHHSSESDTVEHDLFYFPEKDWPKRELLEKAVAKSYYDLVK